MDFIIGDKVAIEVKATRQVTDHDLKNLKLLEEEHIFKHYFLVSHDKIAKKQGHLHCLYWKDFMEKLWGGEII